MRTLWATDSENLLVPFLMMDLKPTALCGFFALAALLFPRPSASAIETQGIAAYRSIDGSGNHPTRPDTGRAQSPLIRLAPAAYGDGKNLPRGVAADANGNGDVEAGEQTGLPSPRRISNLVHDQGARFLPSRRRLNQLVFQFGQFLSHDLSLAEPNPATPTGGGTGKSGNERFSVPVPAGDPVFAFAEMPTTRSVAVAESVSPTGKREQINTLTAFLDGSQVYGSDAARAGALRSFAGGLLKTAGGGDGEMLPYNTLGLANANAFRLPESKMFAAGDVRANEQVGLIVMHTLWVREHNRVAREIAVQDFSGRNLSDPAVDEAIYQRARAVVVALLQKITYYEWLPALIGYGVLDDYAGYDPSIDPQISNEFTTAAFRIGHTMLPPVYRYPHPDGTECELSLLEAFFNPDFVSANGIDAFCKGLVSHRQQEIDRFVVGEVRNFLFGPALGGLDLPALNLQRGRDHGLPDFNTVRCAYGLEHVADLLEMTGDPEAAAALHAAYGTDCADTLDLWTGGLCETPLVGTNLGETFTALFVDQFTRLRDGDRFHFENEDLYPEEFVWEIWETSFADVIRRNTSIRGDEVNDYAFFEPGYHPFQPDCRIGRGRQEWQQFGRGIYNLSCARQTLSLRQSRRRSARFHLSLGNDGAFVNPLVLSVGAAPRFCAMTCFDTAEGWQRNVTAAMRSGRFEPVLDPGAECSYEVRVNPGRVVKRGRRTAGTVRFHSWHYWDGWGRDAAAAKLDFR